MSASTDYEGQRNRRWASTKLYLKTNNSHIGITKQQNLWLENKKHFWTNSVVTTWLWFLFEGAASAASRILQEMTPIFFQHPDKLNLVMLEGEQRDSGLHVTRKLYVNRRNFILPGNSMLSAETSCYQEKLCVTTRNFIFPAETSCYQQKLHVTRRNFMLTAETPCYQ